MAWENIKDRKCKYRGMGKYLRDKSFKKFKCQVKEFGLCMVGCVSNSLIFFFFYVLNKADPST